MFIYLGVAGGLFALMTFVHFFVDWICQTHAEAMAKHNNAKVRARHCLIYTLGFIPIMCFFSFGLTEWLIALNILFWSHFIEDTYIPVMLWAKYIRKVPEFDMIGKPGDLECASPMNDKEAFIRFVTTPLGKILMIAVDQIIHLTFLFPIIWMALHHL